MDLWGVTHRGKVREQNQDAFACKKLSDTEAVVIVCDGMGGARAGNIASTMAVDTFIEEFLTEDIPREALAQDHMERAAARANEVVYRRSGTDFDCMGMGTTLVAAFITEGCAHVLNEGDSRAYHINAQGIVRVTRDHSLVEDLVERGDLTRDQARTHPHKNLITRALGAEPKLHADYFNCEMKPGDFLLLCSDGLSNVVTEQEILYEVVHGQPVSECCERLLQIALDQGAPDNVTIALVQY